MGQGSNGMYLPKNGDTYNTGDTLPNGATYIYSKPYSKHKGDKHLRIVLAKWEKGGHWEYITWMYNVRDNYAFHGHYYLSPNAKQESMYDYLERGKVRHEPIVIGRH